MYSCIIVDDEEESIQQIEDYIPYIPSLHLERSYLDPVKAIKGLYKLEKPVDFLFIDVVMPVISGLTLAKLIAHKVNYLVIVTAHAKYAYESWEVNAVQFIHKPYNFTRFQRAVTSIFDKLAIEKPSMMMKMSPQNMRRKKVYLDDIIAIEAADHYVKMHTTKGMIMRKFKLSDVEQELAGFYNFQRASRFFIVNTRHIEAMDQFVLHLSKCMKVAYTDAYREDFKHYRFGF